MLGDEGGGGGKEGGGGEEGRIEEVLDAGEVDAGVLGVRVVAVDQEREQSKCGEESGRAERGQSGLSGEDSMKLYYAFGRWCEGVRGMGSVRRFDAVLNKGGQRLGWTVVRVPFEPAEVWTTMVRRRVRGTVNGYGFRTSLFPDERGGWFVLVNARMQAGGGVGVGQKAAFTLEPDLEARPAGLPEELDALLDEAEGMREWYGALSESMRREIGKWVEGVKGEDARQRRAEQMAERILATMDAERELPPLIAGAMKRTAGAAKGWAKMTETQRRGELFAVFYYQGVEAREKRVNKLVEGAAKRGF